MLDMILTDPASGISGKVDAVTVMADGLALARIEDHWFIASVLVG
jgi:hypothetical protein